MNVRLTSNEQADMEDSVTAVLGGKQDHARVGGLSLLLDNKRLSFLCPLLVQWACHSRKTERNKEIAKKKRNRGKGLSKQVIVFQRVLTVRLASVQDASGGATSSCPTYFGPYEMLLSKKHQAIRVSPVRYVSGGTGCVCPTSLGGATCSCHIHMSFATCSCPVNIGRYKLLLPNTRRAV